MKNVVFSGHQPNFLPYMGFFYKIFKSDIFVLDDDVQYTSSGCSHKDGIIVRHNSNVIRVGDEAKKITVPVKQELGDRINEVRIVDDGRWKEKLMKTVRCNYGKHPYAELGLSILSEALDTNYERLSDLNIRLINDIVNGFGFETKIIVTSRDVPTKLTSNARNIFQCSKVGANVYYSGVGGKAYNDEKAYAKNGIRLEYSDYVPVRYRQFHKKDFIEDLSVLDYVFNCGFQIPEDWSK